MRVDESVEVEIRAVLEEFNKASSERDLDKVMQLFAHEKMIFVGSESGAKVKGTEQIRRFFEELFSGPITYGFRWEEIDIDVIGEAAWAFICCNILTISAAGHHEHPYRITGVFRRGPSGWQWVHYHGSQPAG